MERLLQPMANNKALASRSSFTAEQVEDLTAQLKIMSTHLGFSHVHRVVHIELNQDAGYPMLICVFCETTLEVMARAECFPTTNSPSWNDAARQLPVGFHYIRWHGLVHSDLHSGNIFVLDAESPTPRCVIGDLNNCSYENPGTWAFAAQESLKNLSWTLLECLPGVKEGIESGTVCSGQVSSGLMNSFDSLLMVFAFGPREIRSTEERTQSQATLFASPGHALGVPITWCQ